MVNKGHKIIEIKRGSIADEAGIEPGDKLISINGKELVDIIDYMELIDDEFLELYIVKEDGREWIVDIEKESFENIGLVFEKYLLSPERKCSNNCIFCFVDQLPKQMRDSLYFKDDDWRLSFLMGNYITLTNMSDNDIKRIIEKRLSPLYISIHTTNHELRSKMLGNKRGGEVLKYLDILCRAGIKLHCQIVLCPGWNDGSELDTTINDLLKLSDCIESLAVVPVGLTSHREGLTEIKRFTKHSADEVIRQIERWQKKGKEKTGTNFVYAADEFYVMADREFPDYDAYDDFPQIENGVGLVTKFVGEFNAALSKHSTKASQNYRKVTVVTGISAYKIIGKLSQKAEETEKINIQVIPVKNYYFGENVTVAGLVTGTDIIAALKDVDLGEKVLIPHVMLRKGADVFLDDVPVSRLQKELGVPVLAIPVDGSEFFKALVY